MLQASYSSQSVNFDFEHRSFLSNIQSVDEVGTALASNRLLDNLDKKILLFFAALIKSVRKVVQDEKSFANFEKDKNPPSIKSRASPKQRK